MGLFSLLWGGLVLDHYLVYRKLDKDAKQQEAALTEQEHQRMLEGAQYWDSYYERNPLTPQLDVNPDFYGDGSLRHDSGTGFDYPKGRYFCNKAGYKADKTMAGPELERPDPKNAIDFRSQLVRDIIERTLPASSKKEE